MNNQNVGTGSEVMAQDPGIFANPNISGQAVNLAGERQVNQVVQQRITGMEGAIGAATMGASMTSGATNQVTTVNEPVTSNADQDIQINDYIPEGASDGERIEAAWIQAAERLVEKTRDNPNRRLVGVALLKESYLRERFNRIIGGHN